MKIDTHLDLFYMEKIFIETIAGDMSNGVLIKLFLDTDGMKYTIHDSRTADTAAPAYGLDIQVPKACRREIMRCAIPNINGKTGTLYKNCQISQLLYDFIIECWEMIISEQRLC